MKNGLCFVFVHLHRYANTKQSIIAVQENARQKDMLKHVGKQ